MLTTDGDEHRALSPPHREQMAEDPPPRASCGPDHCPRIGATGPTLLLFSMLQSSRPPDFSICAVEVWFYSHKWSLGKGFVVFDTRLQWKARMQHLASLFYSTSLFSFAV